MKFENDRIRIVIEKKQRSKAQQKENGKKHLPAVLIALLLMIVLICAGSYIYFCKEASADQVENYGQVEGEYVAATYLAAGLQDKYADKSIYPYTYGDPIEDLGRNEAITFKLGYDVADLEISKWTEVFALYQDSGLTKEIGASYSFDKKSGIITLTPSQNSTLYKIYMDGLYVETIEKYPHSNNSLFDKGAGNDWGNLGTMYLASYRDKETGRLLDEPEVSIVTIKGEIAESPRLTYSITEDGRPVFYWNEIEEAEEYFICQTVKGKNDNSPAYVRVLDITRETSWMPQNVKYELYMTTNNEFRTYKVSEDDWKNESHYDEYLERYGEPGIPQYDNSRIATEEGICVIAVNMEGTSMISNEFSNEELAANLPYQAARNTEKENGFEAFAMTYESVEKLPSYDYITMCDGYTSMKLIDYQTEKAYLQDVRFVILDPDTSELTGAETYSCLIIPYKVEGTSFINQFTVSCEDGDYPAVGMEKDLAFLEDRENKLRKKSGMIEPEYSLKLATHEELKPEKIRRVDTEVFANSALSEYLAINMLGGAGIIDLSEFPEAKDKNLLHDAFMEAYHQNPLILGIKGYRINARGTTLRVVYRESLENQARKQKEIKAKVSEIIEDIITEDMTDQEKELAINQYLCDTITYDEEALLNAQKYGYMGADKKFNDSFGAYGALIEGKCVCMGYASAFKLLAEEAGLETIVVTGFLEGGISHAWNKVKIDNEWQIVDVTNNDNEYFVNALLNLPSSAGERVLIEDKEYMLDKMIPDYVGESDNNEYYHLTDNYFPVQETAEKLSAELAKKGSVTLRTVYDLNDEKFYEITDAVYEIMGDEIDLSGYHWLGVIYLQID